MPGSPGLSHTRHRSNEDSCDFPKSASSPSALTSGPDPCRLGGYPRGLGRPGACVHPWGPSQHLLTVPRCSDPSSDLPCDGTWGSGCELGILSPHLARWGPRAGPVQRPSRVACSEPSTSPPRVSWVMVSAPVSLLRSRRGTEGSGDGRSGPD